MYLAYIIHQSECPECMINLNGKHKPQHFGKDAQLTVNEMFAIILVAIEAKRDSQQRADRFSCICLILIDWSNINCNAENIIKCWNTQYSLTLKLQSFQYEILLKLVYFCSNVIYITI